MTEKNATGAEPAPRFRRTARISRYVSIAIGLAVVAIYALIYIGKEIVVPACDQDEVQTTLKELVGQMETAHAANGAAKLSDITGVKETSYDSDRNLRTCSAVAKFDAGDQATLSYTTEWKDRGKREFQVALQPYERAH
jgi:hypothetical protein